MSKPTWHGGLPWGRLRRWYRLVRRTLFSAPEPDRPAVQTDASLRELRRALGQQSFAPNWEYSYHKRGEDLNLARVVYGRHPVRAGTGLDWWQTHVRGWKREDGTVDLRAHWEPEPTEHPKAHLDGVGHSIDGGMQKLREAFDEAGIPYTEDTADPDSPTPSQS